MHIEDAVQWCGICNKRAADGMLGIETDDGPMEIPACTPCVRGLDWSAVDEDKRPQETP